MKPGSTLWLLRHELRLDLRRVFAKKSGNTRIFPASRLRQGIVITMMALLAHGMGFVFATSLNKSGSGFEMLLLVAIFLALPSGLRVTASALFQCRDHELIGASPLPVSRVFAVRLLYLVAACWAGLACLLGATADIGLLMGASWAVPVWISTLPFAVILASLCLALGLALSRLIGARRAENLFHYLGVLVLLVVMLGAQSLGRSAAEEGVGDTLGRLHSALGAFSPGAAMAGDWLTMAGLFAVAGFCVALLFWRGPTVLLACAGAPRASRVSASHRHFAAQGLWLAWRKEWKLVLRTPKAAGDVLTQLASFGGGFFVCVWSTDDRAVRTAIVAGFAILLAMQIVERLVHWGRALEQAPDLLLGAPLSPRRVSAVKLGMAAFPGVILCCFAAPALAAYSAVSALLALVLGPVLTVASGLIEFSQVPLVAVSAGFGGEARCLASPQGIRFPLLVQFVTISLLASLLASQFIPGFLYAALPLAVIYALIVHRAWRRACENGLFER